MSAHPPFRFGVQFSQLPAGEWQEWVEHVEALGYASVPWADHFGDQWEPVTALAAVAAVTQRVAVGSLVYDVDYRHPVVLAKAAATLQIVSGGRHEFGIGAGWMQSDYDEAGLPFDRAGVRIARLAEALAILRSMWTNERTTFEGEHYRVRDVAAAAPLGALPPPRLMIGGGGPKLLALAGAHADIVGLNPKVHEGRVTAGTAADCAPERMREKVRWVREAAEAAGRSADAIEWSSLVFVTALTDDPKPLREALAKGSGMTVEQVADCPLFLTGSPAEVRERLERRREELGISYVVVQARDREALETFAEHVVAPLSQR